MKRSTMEQGSQRVFPISGQLDAMAVKQLRPSFADIAEKEQRDIRLDLTNVNFIDSSGIGAIVFMYKRVSARNKKLTITGLHGQPLELIRFLRIDKTIPIETASSIKKFAVAS